MGVREGGRDEGKEGGGVGGLVNGWSYSLGKGWREGKEGKGMDGCRERRVKRAKGREEGKWRGGGEVGRG